MRKIKKSIFFNGGMAQSNSVLGPTKGKVPDYTVQDAKNDPKVSDCVTN